MKRQPQRHVGWYGTLMKWALILVALILGVAMIIAIVGKIDKRVYPAARASPRSRR